MPFMYEIYHRWYDDCSSVDRLTSEHKDYSHISENRRRLVDGRNFCRNIAFERHWIIWGALVLTLLYKNPKQNYSEASIRTIQGGNPRPNRTKLCDAETFRPIRRLFDEMLLHLMETKDRRHEYGSVAVTTFQLSCRNNLPHWQYE